MTAADSIPVFVLTGFLGSGKTTLLKSLLAHPGLGDTAVVINELGEVGLDHLLVREVTEEVVLLGSGCVCCAMRDDLVTTLSELHALREGGSIPAFSRVVVETTGLADPAPIVQTLISERDLRRDYVLSGLVTTVDAVLGERELDTYPESVKQAAIADHLVVTKSDLATAVQRDRLGARLSILNPGARVVHSAPGSFPGPELLFTLAGFEGGARPEAVRNWINEEAYRPRPARRGVRHDGRISTFVIRIAEPVDWTPFVEWLELLLASRGECLLRVKGLLNVAGRPRPVVIQGVQHMFYPPSELTDWPDPDRATRIVFITRDLTHTAVETSLRQVLGVVATSK
ncbi:MAG: GTP-binding protein [Betaproteobacteria bacterium]|nr:GTP-binding protein [Betaproteobacteria bacterium]